MTYEQDLKDAISAQNQLTQVVSNKVAAINEQVAQAIQTLRDSQLNWRGSYQAATAYRVNDVVEYQGSSYINIAASSNQAPSDPSAWRLLVRGAQNRLSAAGDLLVYDGQNETRLPAGDANQYLVAQGRNQLPVWRNSTSRSNQTFAQLPRLNDWGGLIQVFPAIVAGGKAIKVMGRNYGAALVSGYDEGDFYHSLASNAQVNIALDADDFFIETAVGHCNVYAVTNKGYVYAGGYNPYGQLGQGDSNNRSFLARLEYFVSSIPKKIRSVRVAYEDQWQYNSVFFLTDSGEVWGCGYNGFGQLGNGTTSNQSLPVRCGNLSGISGLSVSGSLASVYAWNDAGQLWVWGRNSEGQLGLGDAVNRSSPVLSTLGNIRKVVSVAGGHPNGTLYAMALALKTDGTLYATGQNPHGCLGVGDANNRSAWTALAGNLSNVSDIAIAGGLYRSCFAIVNGRVFAWGFNDRGTCASGDFVSRNAPFECVLPSGMQGTIKKVLGYGNGGTNAAFFWSQNNRLAAAGSNSQGNCGLPYAFGANNGVREVVLPSGLVLQDLCASSVYNWDLLASWLIDRNGELYAAGYNETGIVATDFDKRAINGGFRPCLVA